MTGETTLRGRVMPVGGSRRKSSPPSAPVSTRSSSARITAKIFRDQTRVPRRPEVQLCEDQQRRAEIGGDVMRVVVGLSGGVDSSVAAYLLRSRDTMWWGFSCATGRIRPGTLEGDCPWYDDHMFAELVAKRLDIPFHLIDLSDEYRRRVVDYMFAEYGRGRTPNRTCFATAKSSSTPS